ncbi:ATP-binding protein [Methanohalobium sp.]|uniref:sensor histidine kinase n=1 Tax=Methanohalobium sp. TaxID=2837493 RepID=UPI0025E7A04E|nr:ATP-binding protein [Methanohalobium sp.]
MSESNNNTCRVDDPEFFQNLVQSLPDNLAVLDESGDIIYVNENWRQFALSNGLDSSTCSEGTNYLKLCDESEGEWSDEAPDASKGINEVINGDKIFFELEYPCHSLYKYRWFMMKVVPVSNNYPTKVLVYHIDVTKMKLEREGLVSKNEDLQRLNEFKDIFADIMRHDLLNPAGLIKGYVQLLLNLEADDKKRTMLEKIKSSDDKLVEMIENAAELAKLGTIDNLEFKKMDLCSIFKNVINDFEQQIEDKQLNIDFLPDYECFAMVNPSIERVFSNLLSNAIKYSPEKSIVSINIHDKENYWKVTVTDSGEGVPDDIKPHVFYRFQRIDKKGIKGVGLGLAIVKRIVELHKGQVGVDDNPEGSGSRFWVALKKC